MNSPHKGPVTRKINPFDDVIICRMLQYTSVVSSIEVDIDVCCLSTLVVPRKIWCDVQPRFSIGYPWLGRISLKTYITMHNFLFIRHSWLFLLPIQPILDCWYWFVWKVIELGHQMLIVHTHVFLFSFKKSRCFVHFESIGSLRNANNAHHHAYMCDGANKGTSTTIISLIAMFLGPAWGPSGADRTQVGPMLAPWTLLSGLSAKYSQNSYNTIMVPRNTMRCHYNTVNFLKNSHNRHPIALPWGQGMDCLLWVWSLIYVMLLSSQVITW